VIASYDTIILISAAVLVVVSFVVNIVSAFKISGFSEELNRLEENLETAAAANRKTDSSVKSGSDTRTHIYDSKVFPSAEKKPGDSGSRYRPPGSTPVPTGEPGGVKPETTTIRYRPPGKSGMRIPDQLPGEKRDVESASQPYEQHPAIISSMHATVPSSSEPLPDDAFITSGPVVKPKPQTLAGPEPEAAETPAPVAPAAKELSQDELDLIKNYLGGSSKNVVEENAEDAAKDDGSDELMKAAGEVAAEEEAALPGSEESEVLDVIADTAFFKVDDINRANAVNPFDSSLQKVDFETVRKHVATCAPGGRVTIDFKEILFLTDNEFTSLSALISSARGHNVAIGAVNVAADLNAELLSKCPGLHTA